MADLMIIMEVLNLSTSRALPYVRSNTVHVSTEGPLTGTTNADGGDSKHLSPTLQPVAQNLIVIRITPRRITLNVDVGKRSRICGSRTTYYQHKDNKIIHHI